MCTHAQTHTYTDTHTYADRDRAIKVFTHTRNTDEHRRVQEPTTTIKTGQDFIAGRMCWGADITRCTQCVPHGILSANNARMALMIINKVGVYNSTWELNTGRHHLIHTRYDGGVKSKRCERNYCSAPVLGPWLFLNGNSVRTLWIPVAASDLMFSQHPATRCYV